MLSCSPADRCLLALNGFPDLYGLVDTRLAGRGRAPWGSLMFCAGSTAADGPVALFSSLFAAIVTAESGSRRLSAQPPTRSNSRGAAIQRPEWRLRPPFTDYGERACRGSSRNTRRTARDSLHPDSGVPELDASIIPAFRSLNLDASAALPCKLSGCRNPSRGRAGPRETRAHSRGPDLPEILCPKMLGAGTRCVPIGTGPGAD